MIATRFTELVGCTVPIQQAGMGGVSPPELVAAVSEAGALGMLGMGRPGVTAETIAGLLAEVRALTDKPFGVNFIISPWHLRGSTMRPPLDLRCIEIAASTARVVEFFFNEPDASFVDMVHAGGALACWQVGSTAEAVAAAKVGCDFVIVQGVEAGGHVRGTISTLALLGEVIDAVDVPVLAAGGVGTGRALAAALAAGADGVRMGTRFAAAAEAGTHPDYVAAMIAARAEDTTYTEAFSTGWGAPHRVLSSSLAAGQAFEGKVVGETGLVNGERIAVARLMPLGVDKTTTGTIAAMSLFAGQSVGAVKRIQPAAEIVRELIEEMEQALR